MNLPTRRRHVSTSTTVSPLLSSLALSQLFVLLIVLLVLPLPRLVSAHINAPSVKQADEALTTFPPCPLKLPVRRSAQRIVGGRTPSSFLASQLVSFKTAGCGGTLLSPDWVLTAAHCALSLNAAAYVGGSNYSNGFETKVDAIFKHPSFDFPKNDIAVVHLAQPVPGAKHFVRVNSDALAPYEGEFARVVGYGFRLETFDVELRGLLHQVDVPVISYKKCKSAYMRVNSRLVPGIDAKVHTCAGYGTGGCDACLADSGGPLLVYDAEQRLVQVGVVSFGYGCGRKDMAGGYSRVAPFVEWMRSVGAKFETRSAHAPVFRPGYSVPASSESTSASASGGQTMDTGPVSTDNGPVASVGPVAQDASGATLEDGGGGNTLAGESLGPSGGPGATVEETEPGPSSEADGSGSMDGTGVGGSGSGGDGAARLGGSGGVSAAAIGSAVTACVVVVVAVAGMVVYRRRGGVVASQQASSTGTTPRVSMA